MTSWLKVINRRLADPSANDSTEWDNLLEELPSVHRYPNELGKWFETAQRSPIVLVLPLEKRKVAFFHHMLYLHDDRSICGFQGASVFSPMLSLFSLDDAIGGLVSSSLAQTIRKTKLPNIQQFYRVAEAREIDHLKGDDDTQDDVNLFVLRIPRLHLWPRSLVSSIPQDTSTSKAIDLLMAIIDIMQEAEEAEEMEADDVDLETYTEWEPTLQYLWVVARGWAPTTTLSTPTGDQRPAAIAHYKKTMSAIWEPPTAGDMSRKGSDNLATPAATNTVQPLPNPDPISEWMLPTGKRVMDYFKRGSANLAKLPSIPHHQTGQKIPMCLHFHVKGSCRRGQRCTLSHTSADKLDTAVRSKVNQYFADVYAGT